MSVNRVSNYDHRFEIFEKSAPARLEVGDAELGDLSGELFYFAFKHRRGDALVSNILSRHS